MARMTKEKAAQVKQANERAAKQLADYLLDHAMDKLGDWDFYGATGDDLTDKQYNAACDDVVRLIAEKWLASLGNVVK